MASVIWEYFGHRASDSSRSSLDHANRQICPFLSAPCTKTLSDGSIAGVCAIKPMTSEPVICCPIRLYAEDYKILRAISETAFGPGLHLVAGPEAVTWARDQNSECVAVFGQRWGKELRLPRKAGRGGYFVDWVLAKLDASGGLLEFVAIEVQTIDTTGNYRNGIAGLNGSPRQVVKTSAGLNWENVSKRILPQIIYKGQVLQREELCRKGLFFVTPAPVFEKIAERLGGEDGLVAYALQPASVSFVVYDYDEAVTALPQGSIHPLRVRRRHSTTGYKVQERFNNVTLPEANVYKNAILSALNAGS
jgi:hypothetical protein